MKRATKLTHTGKALLVALVVVLAFSSAPGFYYSCNPQYGGHDDLLCGFLDVQSDDCLSLPKKKPVRIIYIICIVCLHSLEEHFSQKFTFMMHESSWFEALEICQSEVSGSLAQITDRTINVITDLSQQNNVLLKLEFWVGAFQFSREIFQVGCLKYEDISYANWENRNSEDQCISLHYETSGFRWLTRECSNRLPFLCEIKAEVCRESQDNSTCSIVVNSVVQSSTKIHPTDCLKTCEEITSAELCQGYTTTEHLKQSNASCSNESDIATTTTNCNNVIVHVRLCYYLLSFPANSTINSNKTTLTLIDLCQSLDNGSTSSSEVSSVTGSLQTQTNDFNTDTAATTTVSHSPQVTVKYTTSKVDTSISVSHYSRTTVQVKTSDVDVTKTSVPNFSSIKVQVTDSDLAFTNVNITAQTVSEIYSSKSNTRESHLLESGSNDSSHVSSYQPLPASPSPTKTTETAEEITKMKKLLSQQNDLAANEATRLCGCACVDKLTSATVFRKQYQQETLRIDVKLLSSVRRRKRSANDNRVSAMTMGVLAVLFLVTSAAVIIVSDARILFNPFVTVRHRHRYEA